MNSVPNLFHELNTKFYELIFSLNEKQWNAKIFEENSTIKVLVSKHLYDSWNSLNQLSGDLQLENINQNHPEEFNVECIIADLKVVHQHLGNYFLNIPIFNSHERSNSKLVVTIDLLKIYAETWLLQQKIRHTLGKSILLEPIFYFPFLEYCFRLLPRYLSNFSVPNGTNISIAIVAEENKTWLLSCDEGNWTFTEKQVDVAVQIYIDQNIAWLLFSGAVEIYEASQYWQIIGNQDIGRQVLLFRPFE